MYVDTCQTKKNHTFFVYQFTYFDNYLHFLFSSRNRDDFPIEKSERYRIAQNKNAIQLALDHVQREDTGHYTLFAKTKTGKISRKDIELVVEDRSSGDDPPTFVRRLTDLSVKVGTRTRLLVEIRSSSPVKVFSERKKIHL